MAGLVPGMHVCAAGADVMALPSLDRRGAAERCLLSTPPPVGGRYGTHLVLVGTARDRLGPRALKIESKLRRMHGLLPLPAGERAGLGFRLSRRRNPAPLLRSPRCR